MENGAEAAVLHMLCCGGVFPACSQGAALHCEVPGRPVTLCSDSALGNLPGSTAWLSSEMFSEQLHSRSGSTQWLWLLCLWWFPCV